MDEKPYEPKAEDWEWNEEDEEARRAAEARRRRIKKIVIYVLSLALLGNALAFWPQIYNLTTLSFLSKSKELSVHEHVQGYKEAVVLVSTDKGKGTGFHVNGGYIVTNAHVIEDGAYIAVKFPGTDRTYKANLSSSDPGLDIAVLKVDADGREMPAIDVGREWEPGEHVYIIGNPLYFTQIVNEGHVMELVPIRGRDKPALAIDTQIYQGNSGSPVINEEGKAIAVIYATAELSEANGTRQVGLAVPLADIGSLLDTIGK
ncbi:serine protease [Cohnella sp. GCM10027633]|uniref:S1 family peptidase n=1 Tax=unclassified Cohnella TaxID=2636738 RepID=UPI00362F089B